MTQKEIEQEIHRVKTVLGTTSSPYLKKDYEKHLKRLRKQLEIEKRKRE